jgi:hypothetical protein
METLYRNNKSIGHFLCLIVQWLLGTAVVFERLPALQSQVSIINSSTAAK